MPSPSGSVISVVAGAPTLEASGYVDPSVEMRHCATSHAMFTLKVTSIEHASQELQQTTGNVVSLAGTVNTRFVYVALPLVQDAVGSFISWMRPAVRRVLELLVATYFQRQGYCPDVITVGIAHGITVTTPVVPEAIDFRRSEALASPCSCRLGRSHSSTAYKRC